MNAYVIIDNGHGVNTAGKSSPDGRYQEWAWTRRAARALKAVGVERVGVAQCLRQFAALGLPAYISGENTRS